VNSKFKNIIIKGVAGGWSLGARANPPPSRSKFNTNFNFFLINLIILISSLTRTVQDQEFLIKKLEEEIKKLKSGNFSELEKSR